MSQVLNTHPECRCTADLLTKWLFNDTSTQKLIYVKQQLCDLEWMQFTLTTSTNVLLNQRRMGLLKSLVTSQDSFCIHSPRCI
jgi:hypothetical protein